MEKTARFERILTTTEKTELQHRTFHDCSFTGVDLSGADLRGSRFSRVLFVDCNLTGADLRGASFLLCELSNVILARAQLAERRFDGTPLDDLVDIGKDARAHVERSGGTFQHRRASRR